MDSICRIFPPSESFSGFLLLAIPHFSNFYAGSGRKPLEAWAMGSLRRLGNSLYSSFWLLILFDLLWATYSRTNREGIYRVSGLFFGQDAERKRKLLTIFERRRRNSGEDDENAV
jgi:hypothetical protein